MHKWTAKNRRPVCIDSNCEPYAHPDCDCQECLDLKSKLIKEGKLKSCTE